MAIITALTIAINIVCFILFIIIGTIDISFDVLKTVKRE